MRRLSAFALLSLVLMAGTAQAEVFDASPFGIRADPACGAYFGGTPGYDVLDGFPWNRLQVLA